MRKKSLSSYGLTTALIRLLACEKDSLYLPNNNTPDLSLSILSVNKQGKFRDSGSQSEPCRDLNLSIKKSTFTFTFIQYMYFFAISVAYTFCTPHYIDRRDTQQMLR